MHPESVIGNSETQLTGLLDYLNFLQRCGTNALCFMVADKQIDLNNVDLKKLRVKQLKKILSDWDEDCVGCLEKSDFIKKIEMLKKEHTEL